MPVLLLLWVMPLLSLADSHPPRIVVSIKPIHSLVAGVMAGVAEPDLLVQGGASPHDFSLRPSDMQHIEQAMAVFWVSDTLETFLAKPLVNVPEVRSVQLLKTPGITLYKLREGGAWEAHSHHPHDDQSTDSPEHDEHEQAHGDWDAHVWLDPHNAMAMVRYISTELSALDPAHQAEYTANAAELLNRLGMLDSELKTHLAPLQDKPFFVFHDAYQYLERRYGLAAQGSMTVSPEHKPGAKRVQEIRDRIRTQHVLCVFSEPQFQATLVDTLISGTSAKRGVLDPLGAELKAGPESYFQLMNDLADGLSACLGS
ncbi:MAG: zinc ABC transporter substrate-binding protein [Gammaproteobacteria bacterium]|nr:zinc ABC transporter substrate-binding protein [Gammaproteobacteria bacterium]MCP5424795.1 zinc ABC transporter substrate-binding protein [Gammaproteobacteria bacterium]MCP5458228.1 zinc ABC transporter substrate-binding protein [Gammaproteobacteria bacterium]